jgi:hypothetical protein
MPHALIALLFYLSQPFWETKPPERWTGHEIETVRSASPWVQPAGRDPEVLVYLATAAPIEEAEAELRLRTRKTLAEPDPDYADFLRLNRETVLVLAIPWAEPLRFGTEAERKRMEDESVMIVSRKTFPLVGHFPPSQSDPVLRLVFPREVKPADKSVLFRLYLPGIPFPEREVEFRTKDLMYHGKLEM